MIETFKKYFQYDSSRDEQIFGDLRGGYEGNEKKKISKLILK